MIKGIAGYRAKETGQGVLLERSYAGITDSYLATDWEGAADWLTLDYPNTLHIVYSLPNFVSALFSLLPIDTRKALKDSVKTTYEFTKIFYVERLLGITVARPVKGNIYEWGEVNIYPIKRWLPDNTPKPETAQEVAHLGEQILEALESINIYPEKLTSPVGAIEGVFDQYDLPSIWTSDNSLLVDASNYCLNIASYEWRQEFSNNKKAYSYDLTSAYPYFIANLPNTDNCIIQFSEKYLKADWAILKGEIEITGEVTPIPCDTTEGDYVFGIKGKWEGYLTKEEWLWLANHGAGKFTMENGYFFKFLDDKKPYNEIVNKLFTLRQTDNPILEHIVKNQAQGISGKLDQINNDGSYGELFNPVLACMVRSRCRLAVADFIYNNHLLNDLVTIQLDGVKATKLIELDNNNQLGSWRIKE